MSTLLPSLVAEYRQYKKLGDGALAQLRDAELCQAVAGDANSVAVIVWHISGNLESRLSDFLTTDGEKPWRQRDEEFVGRTVTRQELLEKWERGWQVAFATLASLTDDDLEKTVTIRGEPHSVTKALLRSVAHASYHVGQIVYIAKMLRGEGWKTLSIPKGKSEEFNRQLRERSL